MITFRIRGSVVADDSGGGLFDLFVKAYDKDLLFDDVLGSAITDASGRFEIVSEPDDFRDFFERRPDLYFKVFASDMTTLLHSTKTGVKWDAGSQSEVEIRISSELVFPENAATMTLEGEEGVGQLEYDVGDSLALSARGLRPGTAYEVAVTCGDGDLFVSRLLTDMRGEIEPTVIWPQLGLEDPDSGELLTYDQAAERWRDRPVGVELRLQEKPVSKSRLEVGRGRRRPVVLSTDVEGRVLNGFEAGDRPVHLLLRNLGPRGTARIYMVRSQADWRLGDAFVPATFTDGSPAVREVELTSDDAAPFEFASADLLPTGAYDFVLRRVRYGYEEDEYQRLLEHDVVSGRRITGLVVREPFWEAKPILGGCVNKLPIAGRGLTDAPYFQWTDTFEVGESVYGALDPALVDPANVSKRCAYYVIPSKSAAQWSADKTLKHLAVLGGNANVPVASVQAWCVNSSKQLLWGSARDVGEYDVVADFGNNTPLHNAFVPDASYDTPLDIIDGYFVAGFRVIDDPGTYTIPGLRAGFWSYDESDVAKMGRAGTVTVDDEDGVYAKPGGFNVLSRQIALKAEVFFPADHDGVTNPAQISTSKPDYPLVVVVHGNGHLYSSYWRLLEHLARNGFVAASIDNRYLGPTGALVQGMLPLGRANNFFEHLDVLRATFGSKLQQRIGVMGHSLGGEAVAKIARLNDERALGNDITALALAPSDHYGREVIESPNVRAFLVIHGSRDGDVTASPPVPPLTWRSSGFSLFDRVENIEKSMVFVYRATHNGFIGHNESNDTPLTVATQRSILMAYASAFFRRHLRSEAEWDGMLQGDWTPASVLATGAEIYLQHRRPGGLTVDDFEGPVPSWQSSSIGGGVDHATSLPLDPREGPLFSDAGAPGLDRMSPHDSKGLRIRWDSLGDRLTWEIPSGRRDVTGFAVLALRITQVQGSSSNPPNQPQDLRVGLRDSANNERAIRLGVFKHVPFPDEHAIVKARKSALMTVRIPLTSYTIACMGMPAVDLTHVTHLFLDFSINPTGEIEVDDIEFTA